MLACLAVATIEIELHATCIAAHPAERVIAVGRSDGRVHVVDVDLGSERTSFCTTGRVNRLAWTNDGQCLLAITFEGGPHFGALELSQSDAHWSSWSFSGRPIARFGAPKSSTCPEVVVAPSTNRAAILGAGRAARVVELPDLCTVAELSLGDDEQATCAAWTLDGTRIAVGGRSGSLALFDARAGTKLWLREHVMRSVRCVAIDPSGTRLVAGGNDQIARVFDLDTGVHRSDWASAIDWPLEFHGFSRLVLDRRGTRAFLSTGDWASVQAWSIDAGTCAWTVDLSGGNAWNFHLALAPDESALVCHGMSWAHARVLDTENGSELANLAPFGLTNGPQGAAWTADGASLVLRSKHVVVLDGTSYEPLHELHVLPFGVERRAAVSRRSR